MKDLQSDIQKGTFRHIYLLYGEETYLKLQMRDRLIKALVPDSTSMNFSAYDGENISEGSLIDQAETLPFFSDRRVISVNRSGYFKNSTEKIADYLKQMPDYLYLIFTETEVDKRNRVFKAVQEAGRCVQFDRQTGKVLESWVLRLLDKENLRIRKNDMELLLARTGNDMNHIAMEVDKLSHYCTGKGVTEITAVEIKAVISERTENRIFDMVSAVTLHRRQTALDLYADLLALKEEPMRILYLIGRQFNQLLLLREMSDRGASSQEMAVRTGMRAFAVSKNLVAAKRYTPEGLKRCVESCIAAEERVKTGLMNDRLAVEVLLIGLSS